MHWLSSLDTALFHFINGTLANPVFDWLMPILSGNGVPWLLAVAVAVLLVLCFGSVRLRLCALLMVLVVALGDPLVVGTLKDAVSRPRPFVTVPDARHFGVTGKDYIPPLPDGSLPPWANVHSFPSAHAANCFAVAMVGFLFYRRSARFLYPFATAVAFSRVYNGVHYPSDITAGALLGTGYGLAFVLLAQALWDWLGKSVFPTWHLKLPDLLQAGTPPPGPRNPAASSQLPDAHTEWLRLGYLVIGLALIGRWIYVGSGLIGLSEDEAYQWLWSKHLALSYYSKPAGIAFIQWAGTSLFGDNNFGVRFFSPVFAALLSLLMLRFIAREVGARAAFLLLLVTFATPLLVAGSVLMTIDPPFVLCWTWSVLAGWRAVQPQGKTQDWLVAGLAMGLGFLCKYDAMQLVICWAIFFGLQPAARAHLKKAGPWLALLVFGLCTLPVLIWNSQHHWITFFHVMGDAGLTGHDDVQLTLWDHVAKSLNYFQEFTSGELGALNPIFFVAALWAMIAAWQRRAEKPLWCYLLCMSAPVFLGHWLWAFHSRVQLNWIAASVPPMFCLMIAYWSTSQRRFQPWLTAGIWLGLIASVFMHDLGLISRLAGQKLPGDVDPSHVHFARGGRETALAVESARLQFDPHAFIIADHYGTTGLFSFYSPMARAAAQTSQPLVYCLLSDPPINQFPFWDAYNYPKHRQGENALFVLHLAPYKLASGWLGKWLHGDPIPFRSIPEMNPVPEPIASEFASVTNLGVLEIKLDDGRVFQRVQLFGCYHLK
jgi:membrane-associated phospholipid phosphatase